MKIWIAVIAVGWMVYLMGIGYCMGRAQGLKTLRESRMQAYAAGVKAGKAAAKNSYDKGFEACQEQF